MKDSYSEDPAFTQKTVTQGRLIAEGSNCRLYTNADFCPDPEALDYLEYERRRQANWYKQFDYKHKRRRK